MSAGKRLEALERAAEDRGLTPVAWWIGSSHHDAVVETLEERGMEHEMEGKRLASIAGRDVKVLTETPERFALWCEEGALDL